MKIGIDISQIIYGTGVSVYTKNLVENLLKIDKENEYMLFGGSLRQIKNLKFKIKNFAGNFEAKVFPLPPLLADLVWNRLHVLPIEWLTGKLDVFHSSDWSQPPSKAFKVTTVHDLAMLRFPRLTHPKILSAHKRRLDWIRKEVDQVIVPSKATKSDLVAFGLDEKKIVVIPEAPAFSPTTKAEVRKVRRKFKINGKFLLAVGINPRKNTQRIIKAFELVRAGRNLKLVLVGLPSFIKLEEKRNIRAVGQVTDKELSALYTGAEALIFPSLYEGFGLPVLDAFNCRTPVVTSNISSLPEVAGEAAVLVDPYKIDSIVEGIETVLRQRKTLIKKGLQRVKQFSWMKAAKETLEVYNEALK
jgi:glycosyltransferase involved in cell wall biosynthesis